MMVIFSPLVTVGMVLVIMWGMSNVDPRRKEYGQDNNEHIHSREVCPENLFLTDAANGEPAARKSGFVGEEPAGDQSINHGIRTLTQLDASKRRQVAQLVNDLVLEELARLNGCGPNICR